MFTSTSLDDVNRVEEVSRDQHQADEDENREDPEADGNQLTHVDQAGIRPPKMFSEATIRTVKVTFSCQPRFAPITWPVASPAPTMLVTLPPAVFARLCANSFGIALGSSVMTAAEPLTTVPTNDPVEVIA